MKVVVTFDVDEENLDDLVVMAKVYRKKDGYKEFVSVENNLPLRPLPSKLIPFGYLDAGNEDGLYEKGYNDCIDEITGETE